MTEEIKPDNGKLQQPPPPQDIVLTITLHPNGNLGVEAPGNGQLYDEMLCDYMLKKAGRFIEMHNMKAAQPIIKMPTRQLSMAEQVRGLFRKK